MKILSPLKVPFDEETAKVSVKLAKIMGAELVFLNVVDTTLMKGYIRIQENIIGQMKEDGELILNEALELAEKEGVMAKSRLIEGKPYEVILKEEKKTDLVVLKIKRFSGGRTMGSVTKDVLEQSKKPVYIFKGEQREFNKMLVTLDDSECAKEALEFSLILAKMLGFGIISAHFVARSKERAEAGKKVLENAQKRGKEHGIDVDTHLDDGDPAREIVKLSEGFDLIIMGAVGQGAISKFFLGSTARKVTIFSKCDVIVVPPCK